MNSETKKAARSNQEDETLIRDFLAENINAFDRLVLKYQDLVFNLCFRIVGDYDDASDCAQETFIKVHANLKNFAFRSSFTTWLYRIAINTCRTMLSSSGNRMRKKMVRIDRPGDAESGPVEINDCSSDPGDLFEKNEQSRVIHRAIDSLPDELKVLVVLRDLEGNSYEEISEITGVNLGTVKSRLARARHLLRESLREVL
ncbi:MAG: sigma-70 family RNA polymerase sigma factor [Spirochaetes bacterium]|nr:sigma-70 family RNA polymerase sigma factor [Spirochaetota bacterium]